MINEDWEKYRKDPDIAPFYHIRQELYEVDGVILRDYKIIVPTSLQRKVVKTAHKLGHLGITKTKQMLRERYWFPNMNSLAEQIIGQCFECQVTVKQQRQEPVKSSTIPNKPWETIAIDFGGPYPDGHYQLVAIDKRTRYVEVERVTTTSSKSTIQRLKKMFATHGTPERVESDNGPPFNSNEFAKFAEDEGFHHHKVTPHHARANGEAESFMKMLNKTEQIARLQGQDNTIAIQNMLIGYRSTPHPATGVTPYEAMMNRQVRTKLEPHPKPQADRQEREEEMNKRDKKYKEKIRKYTENKNTKEHNYVVGDYVLLKQTKRNKWTTAYEPAFYVIYRVEGSTIAARRVTDGREIRRDSSYFKLANTVVQNLEDNESQDLTQCAQEEDWREKTLREAKEEVKDNQTSATAKEHSKDQSQEQSKDNTEKTQEQQPSSPPKQSTRPQRNRKRPVHLKDYV